MPHQRLQAGAAIAVRAANRVFLSSQPGDGNGPGDPAAQADQALQSAKLLLSQAGAKPADIAKITAYLTDRAWREPVDAVIARHLGDLAPVRTLLIVSGLAKPEMLVAIEIDAVILP